MNYYADIHAQILPGMASLHRRPLTEGEAQQRLSMFHDSNIKLAVAAPYFDAERTTLDTFLKQRAEKIQWAEQTDTAVHIVPGAVVKFSYCMESPRLLRPLAVEDSDYILVDLPHVPADEELCNALSRLRIVSGLSPVIVDVDRFFDIWSLEDWIAMRQTGILLQISVEGLMMQNYRKLSLYLLANQYVHFIATGDGQMEQPLRFMETMRMVQRSLPAQIYRRIKNNAGMLLSNAALSSFL
ncbi:MAG: hypothetical protein MJ071_06300 [Oscillospiraceae bacterium]|nr:hypothetical protein [Oscillospiraceae bacterium]